jgi:3-hydroxyethyl bacteriochlorophyllide a dehydrogenase
MREARLRIAAEWHPVDLTSFDALVREGKVSLDGLLTHAATPDRCADAYATAFGDKACLKMVLDWRKAA